MSKRLVTDAKNVLQNAGYIVKEIAGRRSSLGLVIYTGKELDPGTWQEVERLAVISGTVANGPVEALLTTKSQK